MKCLTCVSGKFREYSKVSKSYYQYLENCDNYLYADNEQKMYY